MLLLGLHTFGVIYFFKSDIQRNKIFEIFFVQGHTDQVYSMAWSQCGRFISTVCRDGKVRIYNPRQSSLPVREGQGSKRDFRE